MRHLALAALLALPAAALADTVGTYVAGDGKERQQITISYKDDNTVRMDVGHGAYMLLAGGKAYSVTVMGKDVQVIDLDTLPKFGLPPGHPPKTGSKPEKAPVVRKTGRSETVAGISGDVYEVTDEDGRRYEVVMTRDKRVIALNRAMVAFGKRMAQSLGGAQGADIEAALRESEKMGYGGLLRADRHMVLQAVQEKAQPAAHYALPAGAKAQAMPPMPKFDASMMGDPAAMEKLQKQMEQMMKQQR